MDDSSVEHQSPSVEEDDSKGHKVKKTAMEMRTLTKMEMGMPQMDDTDRMALEAQG